MTKGDLAAAVHKRNAALGRIGRVRGWTIVGAGALTAAIAAAVSAAVPGRTLGARAPVVATRPARLTMPPLATPSELGLQAPGSAPQALPAPQSPAPAPPPPSQPSAAVSGGS